MSTLPSPILPTASVRSTAPAPFTLSTIASPSNSLGRSTNSEQADERSRALQPKQIPPAHPMATWASTKAMAEEKKYSNKTTAESSVRPQSGATTHSKMKSHPTLRIESFSSKVSHHQQSESDDEDEQDENTLPLSSTGRKEKSSTVSNKSSTNDEEEQEGEGTSSEDVEVEDENDSRHSERSDNDSLAELNGPDEESFTANHVEEDEQEKGEREWQPENVPQDGRPPRGKWPTVKYASFLCLRLPDLHEKLVIVVPGIGASSAVRLSKRGIDTVCHSICSYLSCSLLSSQSFYCTTLVTVCAGLQAAPALRGIRRRRGGVRGVAAARVLDVDALREALHASTSRLAPRALSLRPFLLLLCFSLHCECEYL